MDAQVVPKQQLPWKKTSAPVMLLSVTLYGMEYLLPQFGSAVGAVLPPSLLTTPSLLTAGGQSEKQEALNLCKHYSAKAKTLVCYQYCFGRKSETQHRTGCCEEN